MLQTTFYATSLETGYLAGSVNGLTSWSAEYNSANPAGYEGSYIYVGAYITDYGVKYHCKRARIRWLTSSLAGKYITGATVRLRLYSKQAATGAYRNVYLVSGIGLGDNMGAADYLTLRDNTTLISDTVIDIGGVAVGDWLEFPLNATGIAEINKTGYTKFGFRCQLDYSNISPIDGSQEIYLWFYSTSQAELVVNYVEGLPSVTTDAATAVGETSATLNGTLDDDGGEACDCGFEYGLDTGYGTTTPTQSKNTGETFEQALTGLSRNTTYHFRAFATNSAGTSYGADQTLTTEVGMPTVTTDQATSVGQTTATLNGTLDDDGGEACDVRFEYGETAEYGLTTNWQSGKSTGDTFSQEVRGLNPSRDYHFRAVATNSAGTAYGADRTLRTSELSAEAHQALGRHYSLGRHGL